MEGQHGAKAAVHLPYGQRVAGVVFKPGVVDPADRGVGGKEFRDAMDRGRCSVSGMAPVVLARDADGVGGSPGRSFSAFVAFQEHICRRLGCCQFLG